MLCRVRLRRRDAVLHKAAPTRRPARRTGAAPSCSRRPRGPRQPNMHSPSTTSRTRVSPGAVEFSSTEGTREAGFVDGWYTGPGREGPGADIHLAGGRRPPRPVSVLIANWPANEPSERSARCSIRASRCRDHRRRLDRRRLRDSAFVGVARGAHRVVPGRGLAGGVDDLRCADIDEADIVADDLVLFYQDAASRRRRAPGRSLGRLAADRCGGLRRRESLLRCSTLGYLGAARRTAIGSNGEGMRGRPGSRPSRRRPDSSPSASRPLHRRRGRRRIDRLTVPQNGRPAPSRPAAGWRPVRLSASKRAASRKIRDPVRDRGQRAGGSGEAGDRRTS